jgi:hypothetical protein
VADTVGRAERQPHTVEAQRIQLAYALQDMEGLAAAAEEILAVYFQPADVGAAFENLSVMRRAQADARTWRQSFREAISIFCGSPRRFEESGWPQYCDQRSRKDHGAGNGLAGFPPLQGRARGDVSRFFAPSPLEGEVGRGVHVKQLP